MWQGRFVDRAVLVTGAASGIGNCAAERIVREGGSVALLDISEQRLLAQVERLQGLAASGATVCGRVCDIGDEAQVIAAVEWAVAQLGQLNALVNMAGVLRFEHATDWTLEAFRRVIDINLIGTFVICREVLPHLERTGGSIVNASSTAALAGLPYGLAYGASKGGVTAMTRSIAVEYAKRGVRANCVCPGDIATPLATEVTMPDHFDPALITRISSLGGMKGPEVVAGAIAMLISDDGLHITGEEIRVDGGILA